MAKPRRTAGGPASRKTTQKAPVSRARASHAEASKSRRGSTAVVPRKEPVPAHRSTYADAIAAYERGVAAIQRRQYKSAAQALQSVLDLYPEEKELHERARLYLKVCERQLQSLDLSQRAPDELVNSATVCINSGLYDRAIELAMAALKQTGGLDAAEYVLCVALTMKGDVSGAVAHLKKAIELNAENRELARRDTDLEGLRRTESAKILLASPPGPIARRDSRVPPPRRRAKSH
jgi:tetratricopeptide (TPR) repeat protein